MNILKNTVRVGLVVAALSLSLVSCDYLDVVPPEQAGLQDATKTRKSTLGFLFTCYAGLSGDDSPIDHTGALCGSTDEFALPIEWRNDSGAFWDDYAYNLVSAANPDGLWDNYYKYIGQCYLFLRQVEDNPGETLLQEWLPGEREQWLAEVRFLIAYCHFALLRKYGPIPIITEYVAQDTPSSEFGGRCHYDYCVNWIACQLEQAAQDLPPTREGTEWGRATSTMAKALKGRVLMYAASPLWNGQFPFSSWKNKVNTPGDKDFFVGDDAKYKESIGRDDYGIELVSGSYNEKKWERAMEACQQALDFALDEGGCRLYGTDAADMTFYQTELGNNDKWLPYVPGKEDNDIQENRAFKERVMMLRYLVASRYPHNKELIWGLTGKNILLRIQGRIPAHIFQTGNKTAWAGGYSAISPTLYTIEHFYTEDGVLPEEAEYACNNEGVNASMLSFNFPAFMDNTTAASLFDKNPATYVQTPYPNRNFVSTGGSHPYLQLQLPEGVTDFAVSWTQCLLNEVSLLRGFDVLWSADGTFNDIPDARQSYSLADLNAAGAIRLGASFTTSACHCDTSVRFIRIVQTWNCESTTDAGGRWQFRLAELKLYGVSVE